MKKQKKEQLKEPVITLTLAEYADLLNQKKELEEQNKVYAEKLLSKAKEILLKSEELVSKSEEINTLRWEILDLKRRLWGESSEKRLPQNPVDLEKCKESPVDVDPQKEIKEGKKVAEKSKEEYSRFRKDFKTKKSSHARQPIPDNIERIDIGPLPFGDDIDLEGAVKIGEEVTEQYAFIPAQLRVNRITRIKLKLKDGSIVISPMPPMAYPKSNASESILSHIAVSKYADHLPINRQIEIFERSGVKMAPSTISNWMIAAAQRIEPIYNELRELVKKTDYVMVDETPYKVLESDKPGKLHQGYFWSFYLPDKKTPYFEYHKGRGAEALQTLLEGETSVVQSDGYAAYNRFDTMPGKLHLCCWAHVRRKFVEAESYDPPRAAYMIEQIRKLYKVEETIKIESLKKEEILKKRREESYPIIKEMEQWCIANKLIIPANSPIDKAIDYFYVRVEQLSNYVNRADFQIDNNPVERSIRPITLNRKNTIFSGSHYAAHTAAIFFSLLSSCRENNVNPYEWLEDVLIRVGNYSDTNDYTDLLPFNWKK